MGKKLKNTFKTDLTIIGMDPGTIVTGYGIISVKGNHFQAIDFGCIRPPATLKLTDRYLIIYNSVEHLLNEHEPSVLAVETQFVSKKNPQVALKLGMARGIILIAAKRKGIKVVEYSPSKAKKAVVGSGRASKYQVQSMVKNLLNLDEIPSPEDAADALAIALCHAQASRYEELMEMEI